MLDRYTNTGLMAEEVGFEPTVELPLRRISSAVPSARLSHSSIYKLLTNITNTIKINAIITVPNTSFKQNDIVSTNSA